MNHDLLRPYPDKHYARGWNPYQENDARTGLDFGVMRLEAGDAHTFQSETQETAVHLIKGKGVFHLGKSDTPFERACWITASPWAVHLPHGESLRVTAEGQTEIAVVRTDNPDAFPAKLYCPKEIEDEQRGKGILNDASHRIVRTVFDRRNAPETARLVLGEVVNLPGRWSSYPPHHHRQPELYYYRFEPEWGYGHGELGETVYKIRHRDALIITEGLDHAQVSAPGFHMYYLWAIRHLPGDPYTGFEYTPPFQTLVE